MYNKSNDDGYNGFANNKQKKFYNVSRAFKVGNIVATIVLLVFVVKHIFGV